MSYPPSSIPYTTNIGVTDSSDTFATHLDWLGYAGMRTLADNTARDAITTDRRGFGMLVFSVGSNTLYILANLAMGGADNDVSNNSNWIPLSLSGATLTAEAVTGTIDDSNVTFTVSNEPLYIVVNGGQYQEGEGIYSSYVAGTITLSSPVGVGGFIKSYYNA